TDFSRSGLNKNPERPRIHNGAVPQLFPDRPVRRAVRAINGRPQGNRPLCDPGDDMRVACGGHLDNAPGFGCRGFEGMSSTHLGSGHVRRRYERSEEHTSELQSRENLVCRLLLEKKNTSKLKPA